jgi:hypothetical protein
LYRAIAAKAQALGGFVHAIGGIEVLFVPTPLKRTSPAWRDFVNITQRNSGD